MMDEFEITDETLDLLADGELSDEQYRQVLASLDDEPGGWRRCAIALLQAQAFRREIPAVMRDLPTIDTAGPPVRPVSRSPRGLWLALAMAASFLVAFGLGAFYRGLVVPNHIGAVRVDPSPGGRDDAETPGPNSSLVAGQPRHAPDLTDNSPLPMHEPEHVTVVVDRPDGSGAERIELPVVDVDQLDNRWIVRRNAPPEEVIRILRRMGRQLRSQELLVPVDLRDGRRMVVPVEQFELVPVANPPYQ